jgi:hypothetical protein
MNRRSVSGSTIGALRVTRKPSAAPLDGSRRGGFPGGHDAGQLLQTPPPQRPPLGRPLAASRRRWPSLNHSFRDPSSPSGSVPTSRRGPVLASVAGRLCVGTATTNAERSRVRPWHWPRTPACHGRRGRSALSRWRRIRPRSSSERCLIEIGTRRRRTAAAYAGALVVMVGTQIAPSHSFMSRSRHIGSGARTGRQPFSTWRIAVQSATKASATS